MLYKDSRLYLTKLFSFTVFLFLPLIIIHIVSHTKLETQINKLNCHGISLSLKLMAFNLAFTNYHWRGALYIALISHIHKYRQNQPAICFVFHIELRLKLYHKKNTPTMGVLRLEENFKHIYTLKKARMMPCFFLLRQF